MIHGELKVKYANITPAEFIERPNRFIARVKTSEGTETVHVKNTGRCRELLIPGCRVYLTAPGTPGRKTLYDLVAVQKANGLLINMDSQAPNAVVAEWLGNLSFDRVVPEYLYGDSRMDFYMEDGSPRYLLEVKGCTLEEDGVGFFPDAPTERGVKHLHELIRAAREGYRAVLAFVIQMEGITEVRPNEKIHPAFAKAYFEALSSGVKAVFLECRTAPNGLWLKYPDADFIRNAFGR